MCTCVERVWCEDVACVLCRAVCVVGDVACVPVQSVCAVCGVRMWRVYSSERCVWCEDVACVLCRAVCVV